jgi:stress response protein YsnF
MTLGVDNENSNIKVANNNILPKTSEIDSIKESELILSEELVSKIPLYSEDFKITKREEGGHLNIEKKWITSKKKIEIPVRHEELFVNGKSLDYFDENELVEIFSKLKHKLSDVFVTERTVDHDSDKYKNLESKVELRNIKHHSSDHEKNIIDQKIVPLNDNSSSNKGEPYKIELWGEEIIINKRLVKLGEIELKKFEIHEKRKIDVELKKDKLTIKFPGNYKEEFI